MSIAGARIDSRLIHGQIGNYWVNTLHATRIMIIDDAIAENRIEKTALKMATPPGVKLSVLPVSKAAENILAGRYDSQVLLLIVNEPDRFLRLVNAGVSLETINVGNLSQMDGTITMTKSVHITPAQKAVFDQLREKGIRLIAQRVPGDPQLDFSELLDKQWPKSGSSAG